MAESQQKREKTESVLCGEIAGDDNERGRSRLKAEGYRGQYYTRFGGGFPAPLSVHSCAFLLKSQFRNAEGTSAVVEAMPARKALFKHLTPDN
jgi:hypothetical protein